MVVSGGDSLLREVSANDWRDTSAIVGNWTCVLVALARHRRPVAIGTGNRHLREARQQLAGNGLDVAHVRGETRAVTMLAPHLTAAGFERFGFELQGGDQVAQF